jgi:hypothetical protein
LETGAKVDVGGDPDGDSVADKNYLGDFIRGCVEINILLVSMQ